LYGISFGETIVITYLLDYIKHNVFNSDMERKENKTVSVKYYSMEEVTVKGFCNFCKNNIPLIIAVSITLFFTYGIKLFWYSIGCDSELMMLHKFDILDSFAWSIGRFGSLLCGKLLYFNGVNPFTVFFIAFCLIWFFTISWCYIIAVFSRGTGRNDKLIPFALVFMTMPVWAELFYFLTICAECALIISLCPYVIYLLFKGFLDNEKGKVICASILLVFMLSVYQAILPMFCCGVFICFVLLSEYSEYEPQIYRNLCLKLFITLLGSLMVYLLLVRTVQAVNHIETASFFAENILWGKVPIRDNIIRILALGYMLTVGHIPLFQSIVNPIIASYGGSLTWTNIEMINLTAYISKVHGNILLLLFAVFFLVKMTFVGHRKIPSGRRLLYMLAGIGIPLCIILLAIVGGNLPAMRTLFALPLAFAFMLFYLIRTCKNKVSIIVACLSLLIAVNQAQITAQLFYSAQMQFNRDEFFAYELNNLITKVQPEDKKLPVVIVGRYMISSQFHVNVIRGEVIGTSIFAFGYRIWNNKMYTERALAFMKGLGINFDMPDENQIERALKEAVSIPPYPDPGCVKRMQDYIVIRLSEDLYENPWRW